MRRTWVIFALLAVVLGTMTPSLSAAPRGGTTDSETSLQAQQSLPRSDVFIVVMADDPVVTYDGDIAGLPATRPGKGKKINPRSANVRRYQAHLERTQENALRGAGVGADAVRYSYTIALNAFAAKLDASEVGEVMKQPGVLMVMPDQLRFPQTDSTPDFLGLTDPGGPWLKGYTGDGVVVGVIDSGIWPEHPSFADDGSFSALPLPGAVPCEFGNTAHNANDVPFTCNNKLLGARQMLETYRALVGADPEEYDSARDDNGHGTHTASTAAGNSGVAASMYGRSFGTISGIAPRARVIAYKGLGNLGGFTSDLAAAIDQAVADGVDVINYSIGGGAGAPGADELAFLFAANAGVFVATSAGNSGPGVSTLGNPGTMPWLTTVGASTQDRFFQGTIELGNGQTYTGASITPGTGMLPLVDAASAGGDLCVPGTLNPALVNGAIVLCRRGVIGRADKSLAVQQAGGAGMIMYENSDDSNLFSDSHWVPSVHIDNTPGLAIKAYIAGATSPTARLVTGQVSEWPSAPSMTLFSSRGPNPVSPDIIKPDITAPGLQILAGYTPTPIVGLPGELFAAIAGTSMSSPHIAGVFALIKQANPGWSAAMAKSALMTTAHQDVRDNDRVSQADPFDMGAGHVDIGGRVGKGSPFEPGLAYDAGINDYFGYLCDTFPAVFANPAATCAALANAGIPTEAVNLNYPSIGISDLPGSRTVVRTVTSVAKEQGWREYTVAVDAPDGYSVSVSPSTIRLRSGQSATYEVTITNVSAPIGEWRFGSLTWSDRSGHYDVYSPIAVKGSLFSAPDGVTGSGESGSTSFDVKFGYTGPYAAAAHGLVPATVSSGNVFQDANQTFSPSDVASGGADLYQFNLNGVARFRIAMPPEATEADADIDIFVYNPSGVQVASSTAGGTDELVDIVLPANGTWSVYVHGWSAPGGDSNYDLYTWAISATPGGNLSVTSAPGAATIGQSATIGVGWSGATAGQWHLGAVSHTGPSGLMGLTLVEVDNR
jgi:subtilisin family serine protease